MANYLQKLLRRDKQDDVFLENGNGKIEVMYSCSRMLGMLEHLRYKDCSVPALIKMYLSEYVGDVKVQNNGIRDRMKPHLVLTFNLPDSHREIEQKVSEVTELMDDLIKKDVGVGSYKIHTPVS